MNYFSPVEITENYAAAGVKKASMSAARTFILAILAGATIALGAAASSTAAHSAGNVGLGRLISGLVFPFGLGIVVLLGFELFTGNCLLCIPALGRKITAGSMARNLVIVYFGNFAGALLVAAGCALFGQLDYSGGGLALYTISIAAAKCAVSPGAGIALGILCNLLVCAGVLCAASAKDTAGRILGAFIPVALFVMCGFEHCVANMYYIPAGMLAMAVPEYAQAAAAAGLNTAQLGLGGLVANLIPVTIGNIIGGMALGAVMYKGHGAGAR